MQFKKNDITTLKIEDISISGEGIGKADGFTLFVRDAVPGDLAEVKITKLKKQYGYARLMRVIEPSKDRVVPVCEAAGPCGGCQLQNMSYRAQCEWKYNLVKNDLIRIGGFDNPPMQPLVGMDDPYHYRNKAQYPVGYDKNGQIVAGYFAAHSHRLIPLVSADRVIAECMIGKQANELVLQTVLRWMEKYRILPYDEEHHKGVVRHILIRCGYHSDEILVCLIVNAKSVPHSDVLADMLFDLDCRIVSLSYSSNTRRTNVILGDSYKVIRGKPYMTDRIGENQFQISPLSFYQVNPGQTEKLYQRAAELAALTGTETVFDLYCGIGTISLTLAKSAGHVYGVEIVPQAIEDARRNAELNHIGNVTFFTGKAEQIVPELYTDQKIKADVAVIDPPRKGCGAVLLETIVQMAPERVVYVSCNPSTLARDLCILCGHGYRLETVQPFDQFPFSCHVETVVLLSRKDA